MVSEEDDIWIMTIHKSKGLRFSVHVVAGMGNQLNYSSGIKASNSTTGLESPWHVNRRALLAPLRCRRDNSQIREDEYREQLRVLAR